MNLASTTDMPPTRVVLDACVLYDAAVRDLLLRLGFTGLFEPIWSERILDECFNALARNRRELTEEQRLRLRMAMSRAFPQAAHSAVAVDLQLPDPNDVHVVGTAISASATIIVTYNLADFPIAGLKPLGLRAEHPDVFAYTLFNENPNRVVDTLHEHATALRRPPTTVARLLSTLETRGLHQFVSAIRASL